MKIKEKDFENINEAIDVGCGIVFALIGFVFLFIYLIC